MKQRLLGLRDEKYKAFMESLLPGVNNIIGVRLPELQRIAKELAKNAVNITADKADSFEEIMLQGLTIGCLAIDLPERLLLIGAFVPKIDNWAVCDSFCGSLKFTKENREPVLMFLQPYLESEREFDVRFAVVMLLYYYTGKEYTDRVIDALKRMKHSGYYAKMATAWAFSVIAVGSAQKTLAALEDKDLDGFIKNKAIQKIIESRRVDPAVKQLAKALREV